MLQKLLEKTSLQEKEIDVFSQQIFLEEIIKQFFRKATPAIHFFPPHFKELREGLRKSIIIEEVEELTENQKIDLIISLNSSLNFVLNHQELMEKLSYLKSFLSEKGKMLLEFELINSDFFKPQYLEWKEDGKIYSIKDDNIDFFNLRKYKNISLRSNDAIVRESYPFKVFTYFEIKTIFQELNLEIINTYLPYKNQSVNPELFERSIILLCEREEK